MGATNWSGSTTTGAGKPTSWYTPSSANSAGTNKARNGVVGFFENLGSDVRDAAVGLPMGLYNTVRHPERTAKQTARVEWQQWSPLVHGDFGKFGHQFVQHPLGPLLDIAAVASLGLGTGARVAEAGALGSRVAELATRQELKVGGVTAADPEMTRVLSRRAGARFRQNIVHEVTGRTHPFKSESSLYKTLSSKEATRQQFSMNARMDSLAKAYKGLSDPAKQTDVLANMYHQIRQGPARAVKVRNLTNGKAPKGWRFVTEHTSNSLFKPSADFHHDLYDAHARFTTADLKKAAMQKNASEVLIVPERAVRAYSAEAGNSASFLRKAYTTPTKVWKAAVLNMRPAYIVNNAVGNAFMYMMNHSDYTGMRAWVDTVKQVKGQRYVDRMADVVNPKWMESHFGDEVGNTFGGYATEGFGKSKLGTLGKGVQPLNIKMERLFRRALINSEMRRSSEVGALMKRGMSYDEAAAKALRGNPALRARVLEHAHNTLGDYVALSKTDRAIRDVIPFWAWDKTIARHTAKLVDEQPAKAAVAASIGQQGTQSTEQALGKIPDFLKGAIPLPFGVGKVDAGRRSILTTQGINPYSTIPDLADSLGSLVGIGNKPAAESIGSLVGPIPTIAAEGLSGQRFSGAPIPDKGMGAFGNALYDMVVNLPPSQLAAAATGHLPPSVSTNKKTGAQKQKLYQKDWESVVSSWLGLPTRKLSPDAAAAYADTLKNQRHVIGLNAP